MKNKWIWGVIVVAVIAAGLVNKQRNQSSQASFDLNAASKQLQKDAKSLSEQTLKATSQASKELNKTAIETAKQTQQAAQQLGQAGSDAAKPVSPVASNTQEPASKP